MWAESEWEAARGTGTSAGLSAGLGILRVTLLFGSAAVAVALLVTPILSRYSSGQDTVWNKSSGVDYTETGSVGYNGSYTIRRSVLQGSAGSICVIRDNGTRSGDCN